MSYDLDPDEPLEASRNGIRVEKRLDGENFPVPAVVFTITSSRDESTVVHLVDDIPAEFDMVGIGFHPEYYSDHWTAYQNHQVAFQYELESGEMIETVYGIRVTSPEEAAAFLTPPRLEKTEPSDVAHGETTQRSKMMADLIPRERTEVVRDLIRGDRDSLPGLETEPVFEEDETLELDFEDEDEYAPIESEDETDEEYEDELEALEREVEMSEATDGTEIGGINDEVESIEDEVGGVEFDDEPVDDIAAGGETVEIPGVGDESAPVVSSDEGVLGRLISELEGADDPKREALVDALGVGERKSVEVRINHLQSRVEEVISYSDALAAFIDDYGTGDTVIDGLHETVEALSDDVSLLEELVAENTTDVNGVASDLERLEDLIGDDIDDLVSDVEAVRVVAESNEDAVDALEATVTEHGEELTRTVDDVETLGETVESMEASVETIETSVKETETAIEAAASMEDLEALEALFDSVEARVDEASELTDRVYAIEDEFEEVRSIAADARDAAEAAGNVDAADIEATEDRLDSLATDLKGVDEQLEDLAEWRSNLKQLFG